MSRVYYVAYLDLHYAGQTSSEPNELPENDGLGTIHNYPNPFTETTWIPVSLDEPSEVRLTIFNVVGQKVATMAEPLLQAGKA